uniref:riboflavin synthase n=1 Tax=Pararhizobium sp. IMCC3301 TaxID=3067904 RepID=UPI002742814E|nr:riboflavin synthase [Pararhizobium sp. IMCC3301]
MFTGIVSHIGAITAIDTLPEGRRFQISADLDYSTLKIGASIAHSGVCLTVTELDPASQRYTVEAWEEALRLTTAGNWTVGSRVNLERALKVGDELGGHIVSGHIDGKAEITAITGEGDATRFVLRAPEPLAKFIAPKGSVALDGTSLTVNRVSEAHFDVLLIAHSLAVTTWGTRVTGDDVNLEVDTMARYAARLLETR